MCGAKNGSLRYTLTDSKGSTFVILQNSASAPVSKERLSPTSKARIKAGRNKIVENGGMPTESKVLERLRVAKTSEIPAWVY